MRAAPDVRKQSVQYHRPSSHPSATCGGAQGLWPTALPRLPFSAARKLKLISLSHIHIYMHVRGSRSESRTGLESAVCCYPLRAIFSPSAFLKQCLKRLEESSATTILRTNPTHGRRARAGLLVRTVRSGEHQEWQILRTDTVLRYGCVLTVAVCHFPAV